MNTSPKRVAIKTRIPANLEAVIKKAAKKHITDNPTLNDKQLNDSFSYLDPTTGIEYYFDSKRGKKFQRLRIEVEAENKKYNVQKAESFERLVLPSIKPEDWVVGEGFKRVSEFINNWLVGVPISLRMQNYWYIRKIVRALNGKDPRTWKNEETINLIWRFIDSDYNTEGLPVKKKKRAYNIVSAIRSICRFMGWNTVDIEKYFPQPLKGQPLKKRIADRTVLYLAEEEEEIYLECTDKKMKELVEKKEIKLITALQVRFYVRFILQTGTRQGVCNAWSPDRLHNLGKGTLGIRISNIQWDVPARGWANCFLQDKGSELWRHKAVTSEVTAILKELIEEHKRVFGESENRLFPSNEGLAAMHVKKDYPHIKKGLALTKRRINVLLDKINWCWWVRTKQRKGNPNLEKEGECPVTIRSHFFRHNFAAKCRRKKVDSYLACLIGGWEDLSTFKEVYADEEDAAVFTAICENLHEDKKAVEELKEKGLYDSYARGTD